VAYALAPEGIDAVRTLPDDAIDSLVERIAYVPTSSAALILLDDKDITAYLLHEKIGHLASRASADHRVRAALLSVQRAIAAHGNVVADGRDCGSIVFPDADVKFFLTASLAKRAERVLHDPSRAVHGKALEEVRMALRERDERDTKRAAAPLVIPYGAHVIDTSDLTFDEVLSIVMRVVEKAPSYEHHGT
jgi:cytidylate kinase